MSNQFKAFLVDKNNDGSVNSDFTQLTTDDLPKGEVLIKVHYSGINYKDALATILSYGSWYRFSWYRC